MKARRVKARRVRARGTRRVLAVALCSAGLVTLTSPASAGEQPTKREYIEAADALCKEADDFLGYISITVAAESADPSRPPTDAQLEEFTKFLLPTYRELVTDLRALEEPATDRAAIKKLLKTLSKELAEIEDDPVILRDGALVKWSKGAKKYGFEVCGL